MVDKFPAGDGRLIAPASRDADVTPHDTNALAEIPRSLYVGTGGDLVVRLVGSDTDRTYKNVASGSFLPIRPGYVRATGTTADDIAALY